MIRIKKDLTVIPDSLYISQENPLEYDKDKNCPKTSLTTQKRRLEVIKAEKYPNSKTINESVFTAKNKGSFDDRYKYKDIKEKLSDIYNDKCAYCETRERRLQVEHFRPKSKYYWLAYSWDNLLLSCSACNSKKIDVFEIEGTEATFDVNDFKNLNIISQKYNDQEKPKLLNPENKQDSELFKFFKFDKNGSMFSENERCNYTI